MIRPLDNEYTVFQGVYIQKVEGDDIPVILEDQKQAIIKLFSGISDEEALFAYKENKWTLKEVLGHLTDAEKIMAYRALRVARKDKTPLPGFDENEYVANANFNVRTIKDLLEEFVAVRDASISFVNSLSPEVCTFTGMVNDNPISVSALMFIIAGHTIHHLNIIQERYSTIL